MWTKSSGGQKIYPEGRIVTKVFGKIGWSGNCGRMAFGDG